MSDSEELSLHTKPNPTGLSPEGGSADLDHGASVNTRASVTELPDTACDQMPICAREGAPVCEMTPAGAVRHRDLPTPQAGLILIELQESQPPAGSGMADMGAPLSYDSDITSVTESNTACHQTDINMGCLALEQKAGDGVINDLQSLRGKKRQHSEGSDAEEPGSKVWVEETSSEARGHKPKDRCIVGETFAQREGPSGSGMGIGDAGLSDEVVTVTESLGDEIKTEALSPATPSLNGHTLQSNSSPAVSHQREGGTCGRAEIGIPTTANTGMGNVFLCSVFLY